MKKNEESLMKQIAILSESIRSLESAHGDQSVISDLRKHVYQLSIQLNGENPIYVGGNINTAGGSVIFGNQNIYNIKDPKASVALKLFRSYLLSVAQESSELPLGIISPQFSPSLGWEVQLKDIYVDLDVLIDPRIPNNIHLAPNLIRNRSSLKIMLADEKYTKVVLIGDGGMGKTTFLNYLVYCLAVQPEVLPKQLRSLLPIRISLRKLNNLTIKDHEKGTARILWNLIRKDIADHLGAK